MSNAELCGTEPFLKSCWFLSWSKKLMFYGAWEDIFPGYRLRGFLMWKVVVNMLNKQP
jgi:hypothetical protein